ncbi:hypothetical protein FLK61_41440 [Paenalkalicoccus suaedae]|uniref:PD-(D/E)XK nuclease superfamily protein n=1 Tax=Paenalkalicoccus suaedae TaxID=2592382 RepID=A0A859FJS7_9BACI|nr:hypothetical protein [Paenalkalicoccus suaedae]QKS73057.1 hypothetical protein FLK61_41440 [Paenalkalicoccus suaedae]
MLNKLEKKRFRLYQTENSKYKSSLFDLIGGDLETKQTKGLAYLLNLSSEFLEGFIRMNVINNNMKDRLSEAGYKALLNSDFLSIDAEMVSLEKEKVRRDITLSFFYKSKKCFVLVLEAKNIRAGKVYNLEKQLEKYIDNKYFPHDGNVPKLAVALTKYKQSFRSNKFISLTWVEIIQVLHQTLQLNLESTKYEVLKDYYNFITGVDKGMNYYEKEVLSVPAGKTFEEITNYHIHACPDRSPYNYRDPLFIAFRQKNGGVMDKLYKIEDILILPPKNQSVLKDISDGSLSYKQRLLTYIDERNKGHGFKKHDIYRFYILSEREHISLQHCPKPEKNNSGGWYYTLSEVLSGRKVIYTDSK